MINILFVDDEPNILDGLKRMLRPMRREWEMSFATSGEDALKMFGETEIDVVVSDMKMPGMDGAKFLQAVKNQYPQIVRIILSGYSEKEMLMKSVGAAHQYLSKPCDADILKNVITQACELRALLGDENLRRIVSKLNSVPSLPNLYSDLLEELNSREPNIKNIGKIVKKDMGMTVKILQIANSAFFGLRRNVSNVEEAINYLGLDIVTSLALGIGVFSQFEEKNRSEILADLWQQSVAVANLAKCLAKEQNPELINDTFTAGLLHEIGKVVLAVNLPEKFEEMKKLKKEKSISEAEAEIEIFQTTHAQIGAYLLGLWGLPHKVVEAVAFHHLPNSIPTNEFNALTAIYIADVFHHCKNEDLFSEPEKFFDVEYLKKLDLLEKVEIWHRKFVNNKYSGN